MGNVDKKKVTPYSLKMYLLTVNYFIIFATKHDELRVYWFRIQKKLHKLTSL